MVLFDIFALENYIYVEHNMLYTCTKFTKKKGLFKGLKTKEEEEKFGNWFARIWQSIQNIKLVDILDRHMIHRKLT